MEDLFSSFYLSASGPLHDMPVHLPQVLGTQPGSLVSVLEVGDPLITPGLGVMIGQWQAGGEGRAVARASGFHRREPSSFRRDVLVCCLFSLSPLAPPMPYILIRVLHRTRGPGFHSATQKSAACANLPCWPLGSSISLVPTALCKNPLGCAHLEGHRLEKMPLKLVFACAL